MKEEKKEDADTADREDAADEDVRRGKPSEAIEGEVIEEERVVTVERATIKKITIPEVAVNEAYRARLAAKVIDDIANVRETGIPEALLNRAQAVAVFPRVPRAAFGFGVRWGKGLLSRRDEAGKWIPPSYVRLFGGSFGLQLGFQRTDVILVFTSRKAVDALLSGKLTLGAGASAAAGPVGRDASVGTDVLLRTAVFSYSRSRGLFAGVALNGATITIDDTGNRDAYSRHIHADDILKDRVVDSNIVVQPFIDSLNEATRRSQASAGGAEPSTVAADPRDPSAAE